MAVKWPAPICTPAFPGLNSFPELHSASDYVSGCSAIAASSSQAEYKYSVLEIRAGLAKRMPFFSMKSLADTLYHAANPGADLTDMNQRISLEADQNLCIEVESGRAIDGTPVWLAPDATGPPHNGGSYNRGTGTIWNPAQQVSRIQLAGRAAQLASPPAPGELLSSYAYPAIITTCDDSQPEQRWTSTRSICSAKRHRTRARYGRDHHSVAALAVRAVIGSPQMFRARHQWHVDGVSLANNHPLMVAAGPPRAAAWADGQSIYWAK